MNDLQRAAEELRDNDALRQIIADMKDDLLKQFAACEAGRLVDLQAEYRWLDQFGDKVASRCEDILETG